MRHQTLKTYVKENIIKYYGKPLRFTTLKEDSEKDQRLADLSQAYYLTLGEQEKANYFSIFTKVKYSVKTYESSDQKYARQYRNQLRVIREYNTKARERIKEVIDKNDFSMYKIAKDLGVHQSNLNEFYKKKKDTKLNADRVFKIYGF